jgi:hypothetical protein
MKVWSGVTGALGGELWYPLIPGYEQVGEVVHVGPRARPAFDGQAFRVGDRVMCNELRYFPDHCHAWGGPTGLSINTPRTCPSPFDWPAKIPDNLNTPMETLPSSRSVLMDVDVAKEMTRFSTNQVMTQAATAMLAQANQLPQNLMRLLQ